jgi:DNA-binding response OmpR family regulator
MNDQAVVLVADDDEDILNLVAFRIEHAGHKTIRATNGSEALRLAFEREPDLCILDVIMPDRTGFEILEEIRASETLRDVPVILLTATVQDREEARGLELGAHAYMTKPFDPAELDETVRTLLAGR